MAANELQYDISNTYFNSLMRKLGDVYEVTQHLDKLHKLVAQQMRPDIERELRSSWEKSGLIAISDKGGGELYRVATHPSITPDSRGIHIELGAGAAKDVYVRAAVFQYGAIRGQSVRGTGVRFRKQEKHRLALGLQTGTGAKYQAPKKFFSFDDGQRSILHERFNKLFRDAFNEACASPMKFI